MFWLGRECDQDTLVLSSCRPRCESGLRFVRADEASVGEVSRSARAIRLGIVAQVHSHPGDGVVHSDGDDDLVLMPFEGMFSVVVARYGLGGILPAEGSGLHQMQDGRWILVEQPEPALVIAPAAIGGCHVDSFSERRLMRTRSYTGGLSPTSPAGVSCAPDLADSLEGQAAILTAVNLLGRSHPSILLRAPDVPLVQPSPFGGASLVEACHRIVTGIDPANRFEHVPFIPHDVPTMGLGAGCGPAAVYCGGRLWTAVVSPSPVETVPDRSSLIGLGLAVTQASAVLFRLSLGMPVLLDSAISLWTLDRTDEPTGPSDLAAIDLGSVWLVGAGGRVVPRMVGQTRWRARALDRHRPRRGQGAQPRSQPRLPRYGHW